MRITAGVLALVVGIAGCGSDSPSNEVRMLDNTFVPEALDVDAGSPIIFTNDGRVDHNVIADDSSFNSQVSAEGNQVPGAAWSVTVDEPGTYSYYCSLHAVQDDDGTWQGMVGILQVTEPTP